LALNILLNMKLLYLILSFGAGIAVCYIYLRETAPTTLTSEEILYKEQAQDASELNEAKIVMLLESNALREENNLLAQTIFQLENKLSNYEKQKDEEHTKKLERVERMTKSKLSKIKAILELTPQQELMITEFVREKWTQGFIDKKFNLKRDVNIDIKSVLTDEQLPIYEEHLNQENDNNAVFVATMQLGDYPISLSLSEEQKDVIYQNVYKLTHRDTFLETDDAVEKFIEEYNKINNKRYSFGNMEMIWAAKDALSVEQMELLIQSFDKSK